MPEGTSEKSLSMPSSTHYGDIDGDCIPDLLIVVKDKGYDYVEIYH